MLKNTDDTMKPCDPEAMNQEPMNQEPRYEYIPIPCPWYETLWYLVTRFRFPKQGYWKCIYPGDTRYHTAAYQGEWRWINVPDGGRELLVDISNTVTGRYAASATELRYPKPDSEGEQLP